MWQHNQYQWKNDLMHQYNENLNKSPREVGKPTLKWIVEMTVPFDTMSKVRRSNSYEWQHTRRHTTISWTWKLKKRPKNVSRWKVTHSENDESKESVSITALCNDGCISSMILKEKRRKGKRMSAVWNLVWRPQSSCPRDRDWKIRYVNRHFMLLQRNKLHM